VTQHRLSVVIIGERGNCSGWSLNQGAPVLAGTCPGGECPDILLVTTVEAVAGAVVVSHPDFQRETFLIPNEGTNTLKITSEKLIDSLIRHSSNMNTSASRS